MEQPIHTEKIAIIGAGLVGPLLSVLLARKGFSVDVYEKRPDPRTDSSTRGRSIAMSLSTRGWNALQKIGIAEGVNPHVNPSHGRLVHHLDGTSDIQEYGDGVQSIDTVNRSYLSTTLIDTAEKTGAVHFYFTQECEDIEPDSGKVVFRNTKNESLVHAVYDHIIGADGIFSKVCDILAEKDLVAFNRTTLAYAYKELKIPAKADGTHALLNHHVHVWPRQDAVLIAFPTVDNEFVCTLFVPIAGKDSIDTLDSNEALTDFFGRNFPDVVPHMPTLIEDFFKNPASKITYLMGSPWHYKGNILLIGDACHSITPFYGMGMNVGFEDCVVLMELLEKHENNFAKAFAEFSEIRKPNTDAIAELSLKNLNSISDSPDPRYNLKWNLERRIWKLLPDQWTPAYVQIAFTHTPLAQVIKNIERQDIVLKKMIATEGIEQITDEELIQLVQNLKAS